MPTAIIWGALKVIIDVSIFFHLELAQLICERNISGSFQVFEPL
jgi:hypothetical protein